jgi:predicted TIM-barrel fold metal-dependent hydrolase
MAAEFTMDDLIMVSVDDHVVEPPDAFIRHFPESMKSLAPRVEKKNGKDVWIWQDNIYPTVGLNAVVGRSRDEYGMEPNEFTQMREGCYNPRARVDDMNVNGILGSLNFPTFPHFAGRVFIQTEDKAMALIALRAYNDWHIHDWCGAAPGRLIPLVVLPVWDAQECVNEIKRVSKLGVHAVSIPDNPAQLGLPSIHNSYWEPVWKALVDHKMVLNCHIGTGSAAAHASNETPIDAWITTMPMSISNSAADWLWAPMWKKYPTLKMALSEGGIGWIPYFLERADFTHVHHHEWTHSSFGGEKPSDVFRRHILTCFIDDQFGLKNIDWIGEDTVMYEADYPHSDTVWPNCPEYLWVSVQGLKRETIDKVTHLNAMREYSYDPFSILGRENCTVGALRAKATHVDTSPRQGLGGLKTDSMFVASEAKRPVTSGEILEMYARA